MRIILCLVLILFTAGTFAQNYPVAGITITMPANPDANIANWKSGASMITITAFAKAGVGGRIDPSLEDTRILVIIKKNGGKTCGSYNSQSAPSAGFNSLNKVWSGSNAVSLLGQDCTLPPGEYELCVQFFGNGPTGPLARSEEKCRLFTIRTVEPQSYQSPQPLMPANGFVFNEGDAAKPVTFRWTPVIPKPANAVTYRLRVWQLMEGQNQTQAIAANAPVFTKDIDDVTQATAQIIKRDPDQLDDEFVWNIQALNRDGKPIGTNNGTSEVFLFKRMHKPLVITKELDKNSPLIALTPGNDETLPAGKSPTFTWMVSTTGKPLPPGVQYKLVVKEILGNQSTYEGIRTNKPFFEKDSLNELSFRYPPGSNDFEEGKHYAWLVQAKKDGVKITESGINQFIISSGCPRKSVSWTVVTAELNKVSRCAVNQLACTSYTDTVTKPTAYLWVGQFTNSYSVADQNKIIKEAKSWAMYNRPIGCGGYKSVVSLTYTMASFPGSQGNTVGVSIMYGCCAAGSNQQYAVGLVSPGNETVLKRDALPQFKWEMNDAPKGVNYRLKIVEVEETSPEALQSARSFFEKDFTDEMSFRYNAAGPKLEEGKKYAWNITAFKSGNEIGKSNTGNFTVASCGMLNITPVLQCAGAGTDMYNFSLTLQNSANPQTDPGCVVDVNAVTLMFSNVPITLTSSLPVSIQPGQSATVTGQIGPILQSWLFNVAVTANNAAGVYAPAFTLPVPPAAPGAITGAAVVCQGQGNVVYSIAAVSQATSYNWTVPAGSTITSGQGTTSVTVNFANTSTSGNVCVSAINDCGASTQVCKPVAINLLPAQVQIMCSNANPCQGASINCNVPIIAGVTYNWTFPSGWIQTYGGTSSEISVTAGSTSGNITVTLTNACGSTATSLAVVVKTPPLQPGIITGNATPCQGSSQNYSVQNVNGVTYNWTFPPGWILTAGGTTNGISVTAGITAGNITVTASNICGVSSVRTLAVIPTGAPAQPGVITGNTIPCVGTSQNYHVPVVSGVTYNWVFPAGWTQTGGGTSNSATAIVGNGSGNITVSPSNACGNGITRTLAVTPKEIPVQPALINGADVVCRNQTGIVYTIASISGATSYTWTVTGASLTTGQGGTSVTISFPNVPGVAFINVKAVNSCGSSSLAFKVVTVQAGLPAPTANAATGIQFTEFTAHWTAVNGSTGYDIELATNPGFSGSQHYPGMAGVLATTFPGLNCGTQYFYRVRAIGACGNGAVSNSINVFTPQPDPPVATVASGIQATQFIAHWTTVASAASYKLDVSTTPNFTTFLTGYHDVNVYPGTAFLVTGLTCNTTYYYRVRTFGNCNGNSGYSNVITVVTPTVTPSAPTAYAATNIQPTQFTANWTAVAGATSYRIDVSANNFASYVTGYNNLDVGAATSYNVTGLNCNKTYRYRVRAVNFCTSGATSYGVTVNTPQETPHGTWIRNVNAGYTFSVGRSGTNADVIGCPGQVIPITMEVWGGGGGGAAGYPGVNTGGNGGSGGGGGGYAKTTISVTIPLNSSVIQYNVFVGAGGAVPNPNGYSGNGMSSSVSYNYGNQNTIVYASGGKGGSSNGGGLGGNGTVNSWSGQSGGNGAVVTGCNGGAGGLGGAGGGPGRTGPGYYNDGGNGGHGGYNSNYPACMAHKDWYLWSDGNKGGNGRVVITW